MRDFFLAFFFCLGCFICCWIVMLIIEAYIKLWVEGMMGTTYFWRPGRRKAPCRLTSPGLPCSLLEESSQELLSSVCTLWPFQQTAEIRRKAFGINGSWGGDGCCFASVPLCALELPLLPSLPLFPCWELRFWSSKPGQPHDYSADGSNLRVWLWQRISGRSGVWEIPALLQRWIASQKSRVWMWLLRLPVKSSCILFWISFFPLSQGSSVGASGCDPYSHMLLLGWENIREVCSRLCWPWEGGLCGDHGEVSGWGREGDEVGRLACGFSELLKNARNAGIPGYVVLNEIKPAAGAEAWHIHGLYPHPEIRDGQRSKVLLLSQQEEIMAS